MAPDNYDLFFRRSNDEEQKVRRLPVCVSCGEPIQGEHLYDVDGDVYCEDCMMSYFKKSVEDYISG